MAHRALLVFCLTIIVSGSMAVVRCPDGWTKHGFSCYFLKECDVTWDDAERECIALGAHLISIDSIAEQRFLESFAGGVTGAVWIGLNDKYHEGQWFFTDMRRLRPELTRFWANNEPNNNGGNEDCVVWPYGGDKKWNDCDCNRKNNFVCEIQRHGCPDGWTDYDDSCYTVMSSPKKKHFDAQVHCQSIHPDCSLAKIDNHDEQVFVQTLLGNSCEDWIGLVGETSDSGATRDWYYTDGQPLVHDFWRQNEPNFGGSTARICAHQKNDDGWNDNKCDKVISYVCELKKPTF